MAIRYLGGVLGLVLVGILGANCGNGSPNGPGPVCNYAIAPSTHSIGPDGGSATVTVTAGAGCAWTASSNASWVSFTSGASGNGGGSVVYTAAAHSEQDPRTATLTIATQTHTLTQQGRPPQGCTLTLQPSSVDLTKDAATGSFAVDVTGNCAWTAVSNADWLLVTSSTGPGSGTVSYAVSRNTAIGSRTGAIAVGQQAFIVRQQGDVGSCAYSVAPVDLAPCMPATTLKVTVTTEAACPWTATTAAGWIGLSQSSGTGTATVDLAVTENYDLPRDGVVAVRWPTATAGQNVRVAQAGCVYGVSRDAFSFPIAGGADSFMVVQQSIPIICGGALQDRCIWSAVSDVPWITITSSMPRTGDNPVAFTVAANPGAARTGRITVRDKVVVITQACQ
jgi:hypothetical protein